jgi:hypothetical protein
MIKKYNIKNQILFTGIKFAVFLLCLKKCYLLLNLRKHNFILNKNILYIYDLNTIS